MIDHHPTGKGIQFRGYQQYALNASREVLRSGKKRIVLYSPTGSGKTEMGMGFIRAAAEKRKRVAFVVNRVNLVKQTSKRFFRAGLSHGIIQGKNSVNVFSPVLVASIQTVAKRGLPDVDLILIDEGHGVAGSVDYRNLIFSNPDVPVIALTATPFSKGMAKPYPELNDEPLFEHMVVATTIQELIEMGFLVDVDIYAPSKPDLESVKTHINPFGEEDYNERDLAKVSNTPKLVGDIISTWQRMANNKPTVCFATDIAHSQSIVEQFNLVGVPAVHIDCYMNEDEKERILEDFKAGVYKVLSNVSLIAEGFDHPETEVMILARSTKSLIRWIQMVGRVLRPFDGKVRGLVLDHSGSAEKLGYPTEDLPLELDDGSPKDGKQNKDQEPDTDVPERKCPQCHLIKKPGVIQCPSCGHTPERKTTKKKVENVEGELKLMDRSKKGALSRIGKQDIYSQLISLQQQSNKSIGWVKEIFHSIYGEPPKSLNAVPAEAGIELRNWIKGRNIRRAKSKGVRNAAA